MIYARAGERVTCENGHEVCTFTKDVSVGDIQDLENQLGNWKQYKPFVGEHPIPHCSVCGAPYYDGMFFHIGDEWRDPLNVREKVMKGVFGRTPRIKEE